MTHVFTALGKAFSQLGDPAFLRVIGKTIIVTLIIFAVLGFALFQLLTMGLERLGLFAGFEWTYALSVLITFVAMWLLFRILALAVLQFFADEIVQAVEARHYPDHAENAQTLPFRAELGNSLRAAGRALGANLLALLLAVPLIITGIGPAVVFWVVNAWLLGRELQDMVWLRHRTSTDHPSPLGGFERFALGGVIAALLVVPFINFLAPIIGAASAAHLVHRRMGHS